MANTTANPATNAELKDTHGLEAPGDATADVVDLEQKFGYLQELPRVGENIPYSSVDPADTQTKSFFNLWIMTIVLSSVPYGQATTMCESSSNPPCSYRTCAPSDDHALTPSLHALQRRRDGRRVVLDHHDGYLRLRRHVPRRDRIALPSLGRSILLVIPALAAQTRPARQLYCRMGRRRRECDRDLGCQLRVSSMAGQLGESARAVRLTDRTTQLILSAAVCESRPLFGLFLWGAGDVACLVVLRSLVGWWMIRWRQCKAQNEC